MGVHIYCIVPRGQQPGDGRTGVAGAAVVAAGVDQLGIWYSEHDAPPAVDADAVRAHNAVIESAMSELVTPVPMRFGQWFDALERVREAVGADAEKWRHLLARFEGSVEYGVRVELSDEPAAVRDVHTADSGREYMAALARRHAETARRRAAADAIAADLQQKLAGVALAMTAAVPETGGSVSLAVLVARSRTDDYHATLADIRRSRADLRFVLTGPWPPYSFVA